MRINNYSVMFYFIEESLLSEERQRDLTKKSRFETIKLLKVKDLYLSWSKELYSPWNPKH